MRRKPVRLEIGCGCRDLVAMTTLSCYDCYQSASYIGIKVQLTHDGLVNMAIMAILPPLQS